MRRDRDTHRRDATADRWTGRTETEPKKHDHAREMPGVPRREMSQMATMEKHATRRAARGEGVHGGVIDDDAEHEANGEVAKEPKRGTLERRLLGPERIRGRG